MSSIRFSLVMLLLAGMLSLAHIQGFAQSQTAMNMKAYNDYQKTDKALNALYQKILKAYADQPGFIKKFKNAQRLWIQLRDAELAAKYPLAGSYGSAAPMCESIYLESLTKARITFLNVWITGIQEGDICAGSVRQG